MYWESHLWPPLVIALKLVLAMLCGGAIGLERELNRKPAGLRTNVLICFGAALYMIVSRHISGGAAFTDPARLAAQVVAGIGFLGAGVILQARGSVTGLTTAATIFVVGAVGIAIGEGMVWLAIFSTIAILVVLVVLRWLEQVAINRRRLFRYTLDTDHPVEVLEKLVGLLKHERLHLEAYELKELPTNKHEMKFSVVASLEANRRLAERLRDIGTNLRTSTET
jgi:putative Mg2+ transporter-C (MgtC) family protein